MPPVGVIVAFIVVFALIMIAVSVGLKFFDARRKRQVADMLQTASGEPVVTVANLLKELDPEKPTGIKAMVGSLHFSKHAQEMIQQAGIAPSKVAGDVVDAIRAGRFWIFTHPETRGYALRRFEDLQAERNPTNPYPRAR